MLDLFCGRFGWGRAFAERGWEVVGIDLTEPPEIPRGCEFVRADVLQLRAAPGVIGVPADIWGWLWSFEPHFICASSPCEQFSVHGMKCFFPEPPHPELGLKLFSHTRDICEQSGVPYIMENVRSAQKFVGKATHHCGPFYLWGPGVPALMPQGIIKGMTRKALGHHAYKGQPGWNTKNECAEQRPSNGKGCAALAATIPPELANCVADYAERILAAERGE